MGGCFCCPFLHHQLVKMLWRSKNRTRMKQVQQTPSSEFLLQRVPGTEPDSSRLSNWIVQEEIYNLVPITTNFQTDPNVCEGDVEIVKLFTKQRIDSQLHTFMEWTTKAVVMDSLDHEDRRAKCSSSAIDIMKMFYDNKCSWNNIPSRDPDEIFMINENLIYDLCKCAVLYAEEMKKKGNRLRYKMTPAWCTTVNNIEYVSHSMEIFYNTAKEDEPRIEQCHGRIKEAAAKMHDEAVMLLDSAVEKLSRKVSSWMEYRRTHRSGCAARDESMVTYLHERLHTLHLNLSDRYFDYVLEASWTTIHDKNTIPPQDSSPRYCSRLKDGVELLVEVFEKHDHHQTLSLEGVLLQLVPRSLSTMDYIQMYLIERLNQQLAMTDAPFGDVMVSAHFLDSHLHVEVICARDLQCLPSCGTFSLYATIQLLPRDKFKGIKKCRSKVRGATDCPIFELKSTYQLTLVQRALACAMVRIAVKGKEKRLCFTTRLLIGEAFVAFKDIPMRDQRGSRQHIHLSLPAIRESHAFRALEKRTDDEVARKFIKKERSKILEKIK